VIHSDRGIAASFLKKEEFEKDLKNLTFKNFKNLTFKKFQKCNLQSREGDIVIL
jgi:hypothetical protein